MSRVDLTCLILFILWNVISNVNSCESKGFLASMDNIKKHAKLPKDTKMNVTAQKVCAQLKAGNSSESRRYCKSKFIAEILVSQNFKKKCDDEVASESWYTENMPYVVKIQYCHADYCPLGRKFQKFHDKLDEYDCVDQEMLEFLYPNMYFIMPVDELEDCKRLVYVQNKKYMVEISENCQQKTAQKLMNIVSHELDAITKLKCGVEVFVEQETDTEEPNTATSYGRFSVLLLCFTHLICVFRMYFV